MSSWRAVCWKRLVLEKMRASFLLRNMGQPDKAKEQSGYLAFIPGHGLFWSVFWRCCIWSIMTMKQHELYTTPQSTVYLEDPKALYNWFVPRGGTGDKHQESHLRMNYRTKLGTWSGKILPPPSQDCKHWNQDENYQ